MVSSEAGVLKRSLSEIVQPIDVEEGTPAKKPKATERQTEDALSTGHRLCELVMVDMCSEQKL